MRFNIGDKVKILDGKNIEGYLGGWTNGMEKLVGEERTIIKFFPDGSCILSGSKYRWDTRGLEKVGESEPRFKIGDPVRVISGYGKPYHGINWFPGMSKLVGKDVFITEVHPIRDETCTIYCYKVSDDPSPLGRWLGEDWIVPHEISTIPSFRFSERR